MVVLWTTLLKLQGKIHHIKFFKVNMSLCIQLNSPLVRRTLVGTACFAVIFTSMNETLLA